MSNHSTNPHFNKLLLTSMMSAFFSGHAHAGFGFSHSDYNSPRNHTRLSASIRSSENSTTAYVWIAVKNVGEFCYSGTPSGTNAVTGSPAWTPAIVESSGGTIAAGTAHCQTSIPISFLPQTKVGKWVGINILGLCYL